MNKDQPINNGSYKKTIKRSIDPFNEMIFGYYENIGDWIDIYARREFDLKFRLKPANSRLRDI